jgi:hypothetical protein
MKLTAAQTKTPLTGQGRFEVLPRTESQIGFNLS